MNEETTTLGAILEMEPGTKDSPQWVNGEFTALVASVTQRQTKSGTPMFTGTFEDPDSGASVAFSAFGRKSFPRKGRFVVVGGQGISLGEYNGTPQLTLGQKAFVNETGQTAQEADESSPRQNTRSATSNARQGQGNGQGGPLGATVGMALNNAALDMRALPESAMAIDNQEAVKHFLWERASLYLRLSQAFERGSIAPLKGGTPLEREAPQEQPQREEARPPARVARRTTPVNEREAANQSNTGADEEVPF